MSPPILSWRLNSKAVAEHVRDERDYKKKLFDKFLAQHESSTDAENVHMIKGLPPDIISSFVAEHGVDLVVMGPVARYGLLGSIPQ